MKARNDATRAWKMFVARNGDVIREAGLPEALMESVTRWDQFLQRGRVYDHPELEGYSSDGTSDGQYRALVQLADSYFPMGYEYFAPAILRPEDRQVLDARYGAEAL